MPSKLWIEGHTFNNEREYRRYCGLRELMKEGRIDKLQVSPEFSLEVNGKRIAHYVPTFVFLDCSKKAYRMIQVKGSNNALLELKVRLFEALFPDWTVEWWG